MYLKDYLTQIKYNIKVMFSNKYILCILFFLAIPFAINFNSSNMAYTIFEIYIAIVGIVVFADTLKIEEKCKMHEIMHIIKTGKFNLILIRCILNIIFICCFSLTTYFIIYFKMSLTGADIENLNYFTLLGIYLPTTVLLGMLAMTITSISSNIIVGYFGGLIYWVFWLVNQDSQFILNAFGYTAEIIALGYIAEVKNYMYGKVIFLIISIGLLFVNYYLFTRSPYKNKIAQLVNYYERK